MRNAYPSRAEIDAVLDRLVAAWDERDPSKAAALFAEDGVYAASVGLEPGARAVGPAAIETLVARMFTVDDGATSEITARVTMPNGAFWSWRYVLPDGRVELGCDLVIVRDGRIALKDAYRKVWKACD